MPALTQAKLKEFLHYEPETGVFTWLVKSGRKSAGKIAGGFNPDGYIDIGVANRRYPAHRLAWLYMRGVFPKNNTEIDHVNRVRHDNRFKNIRVVTVSCNQRNTGNRKNNISGVKGVCWSKNAGKWIAQINANWEKFFLGLYEDFSDAVCARLAGEQCLGWSGCDSSSPAYLYVKEMLNWE